MLFYRPSGRLLYNKTMTIAIFTREDLSSAQQLVGHIAADFMRTEVLPVAEQIYAKDWSLTRELLVKAGELDLLRVTSRKHMAASVSTKFHRHTSANKSGYCHPSPDHS